MAWQQAGSVDRADSLSEGRLTNAAAGLRAHCKRLNGTTARGLGTLDTITTPNRAVIGVVNVSAGHSLAGAYLRI